MAKTIYNGLTGFAYAQAVTQDPGRLIAEFGFLGSEASPRVLRSEAVKRLPPFLWSALRHLHDDGGACRKCIYDTCGLDS